MTIKRQEIDDMSKINPRTGLPKHVYYYNHPECNRKAVRGTFQMQGKKYHAGTVQFGEGIRTLEEACEIAVEQLNQLKDEMGYWEYLEQEGYKKRVRKKAQIEYHNKVSLKDNRQSSSVLENIRSGNITIRSI